MSALNYSLRSDLYEHTCHIIPVSHYLSSSIQKTVENKSAKSPDWCISFNKNQRRWHRIFLLLLRISSNMEPAGWSGQIPPVCNLSPCTGSVSTTATDTILLSSHLKSSKMVWCSPRSFWTHHELYPQLKFVCCPNCLRCWDARSAHLPWAHSLNWIVRLASFLTMSPCKVHTHSHASLLTHWRCMTLCSRENPVTHTHKALPMPQTRVTKSLVEILVAGG